MLACASSDFIVTSARFYRSPQGDHMFQVGESFYCYIYIYIIFHDLESAPACMCAAQAPMQSCIPVRPTVQSMMAAMQQPRANGANLRMFNLELGFNLLVKLELLLQGAFNLLFKLLRLLCCHAADVFVSFS